MGLYNPQGNDWETCTSILGYSNYAGFDPHCSCWDRQWYIGPDGRPYDFSTGRWMGPGTPGSFDPEDPNNYEYAANDPVNNMDPGNGAGPSQPPLPGQDQGGTGNDVPPGLDIWHNSPECPNCAQMWKAADAAGNDLAIGTAAASALPAGHAVASEVPEAVDAVNEAAAANPDAVATAVDFAKGFFTDEPLETVPSAYGRIAKIVWEILH